MANSGDKRRSSWALGYERGRRHQLDVAPFSLWNTDSQDYDFPTEFQITWIFKNYNASHVEWWQAYGLFTLFTDTPALLGHAGLVTLTIACVPVIFVPRGTEDQFMTGPPMANRMFYCDFTMPDPLPRFKAGPWTGPSVMEAQMIFNHLNSICNVHALTFILSAELYIELADDGRKYKLGSLPHCVAGWSTHYHLDGGDNAFWKDAIAMPQEDIGESEQLDSPRQGHGIYSGVRFAESEDPTASITGLAYREPSLIYIGLGKTSGFSVQ